MKGREEEEVGRTREEERKEGRNERKREEERGGGGRGEKAGAEGKPCCDKLILDTKQQDK